MQEVPCVTNRNGPYKNDLNQGKSQVGFSGAEEPHLENAHKVRWRGPRDTGQLWSSMDTRGLKFSAALWERVVEEEYTLGPNPYLSGDVSRVKELFIIPSASYGFSTVRLLRKDVGDKWQTSIWKFPFQEQTTLRREIALESE